MTDPKAQADAIDPRTSLISRLEAATGPDRGLDALIAAHTGWDGWTVEEWEPFTRGEPGKDWAPEHPPVMDRCPEFTKSLEAAKTLLRESDAYEIHSWPGGEASSAVITETKWREFGDRKNFRMAWVHSRADGDRRIETTAATPAIALCIAALKARGIGNGK